MPPTKIQTIGAATKTDLKSGSTLCRRMITTRGQTKNSDSENNVALTVASKRKADSSPQNEKSKRSALGTLTNAVLNAIDEGKKGGKADAAHKSREVLALKKTTAQWNGNNVKGNVNQSNVFAIVQPRQPKVMTRAASRACQPLKAQSLATIENTVIKTNAATAALAKVSIATTAVKPKKKTENASTANQNSRISTSNNQNGNKENIGERANEATKASTRRISNEFDLNDDEESHYMSALEEFSASTTASRISFGSLDATRRKSCASITSETSDSMHTIASGDSTQTTVTSSVSQVDITLSQEEPAALQDPPSVPDGVIDFDRENWDDPFQASHYAMDIFSYLKERESLFKVDYYMERQPQLTPWMRTLLVDWMVEVQETFELNHETLYLAVKIVDIYLSKVTVERDQLQLLGAAALFISCKYDERTPPLIVDFLYICDGAYDQLQLTRMEMNVFRTIGYDLGIPLSYRFLRRYARCAKVTMPELTLARFILEFSLMNYELITMSESKMASACLFMALRMSNKSGWNKTLEYYSGYKLSDFETIVPLLNASLHQKQRDANKTVRNKYAHEIFFKVSKTPLMSIEQLLEPNQDS